MEQELERPPSAATAVRSGTDPHAASGGWASSDSASLYRVQEWGNGYFGVSDVGTVVVYPTKDPGRRIDLLDVVDGLRGRGLAAPILIRFPDITAHRMAEIRAAFDSAIEESEYRGRYACVYPIKVNQARHVCEEVRDFGSRLGFGLEVGTKPELLAALSLTEGHDDMPIVCNGFKDEEFLEAVVLASRLGRTIYPVVERFVELEVLVALAERTGIRPHIGVRAKLASQGTGRWHTSTGRSKFGLSPSELLRAVALLEERGLLDCLDLLHCHVGSQIADIRNIKDAVSELAHVYVELRRAGAPIAHLDFGGGMGIDYDGSASPTEFSVNYDVSEYAVDIVYRIAAVCDQAKVPHPNLLSESGRGMTAYSSVLVFDVLGSRRFDPQPDADAIRLELESRVDAPQPVLDLLEALASVGEAEPTTVFHDATHARDSAASLFRLGHLSLADYAHSEELAWATYRRILERTAGDLPIELESLPDSLSDIYFCNMSIFQSLPDSWAIDQLFPIMPIHRLDERPTRLGILADMTCDSDGKIERFVGEGADYVKSSLELHPLESPDTLGGDPYYLGVFLVGAYQETLGDLHNLLGDVHAAHVLLDGEGGWELGTVVEGDTVREVLGYVQFEGDAMRDSMRRSVERAIRAARLSVEEGNRLRQFYHRALEGYTYPSEQSEPGGVGGGSTSVPT